MSRVSVISLAARYELLDMRRQARILLMLVAVPLAMNCFFVLGPNLITRLTIRNFERTIYKVAINEPLAGQKELLTTMRDHRLRAEVVANPRSAVLNKRVDVALEATGAVPADLATGGKLAVRVVALSSRQRSRLGATELGAALRIYGENIVKQRLIAHGVAPAGASPIVVHDRDLMATKVGNRLGLSTFLPIAVLYPMTLMLSILAARLGGSKDERTLEAIRTLPMTNGEQIAAKAVVGFGLASLTAPTIIVPLIVASAILPGGVEAFGSPWRVIPVTIIVLGSLAVLHVAIGLFTGSFARTKEELSALTIVSNIPFIAIAVINAVRPGLAPEGGFLALPVFGPLLLLRAAILHTVGALPVLLAGGSSVLWAALLFAGAAKFFGTDRSVLRASS